HPKQYQPMSPAPDVRGAVGSLVIANGDIGNFQVQLPRSKQELEIAEWVEVSENVTIRFDMQVVSPEQGFRSAERIFDRLSDDPTEREAEKLIGAHVQKPHGFPLHRINKSHAVGEFRSTGNERVIELR